MSPELIRKPLHYDRQLRRLWIRGQRCHHGATGALLAGVGAFALATGTPATSASSPPRVLMAERSAWMRTIAWVT